MKRLVISSCTLLWALSVFAQNQPEGKANIVAIKAGRLVDVVNGQILERQVILVEGEKIKAVGAEGGITIPASATIIDLAGATVLPGFSVEHQIRRRRDQIYRDCRCAERRRIGGRAAILLR